MKKSRKFTVVFALLPVLAPLAITPVLSLKDDDFGKILHGAAASAAFLIFIIISGVKKEGEKQLDGMVIEKHMETRQKDASVDGGDSHAIYMLNILQIQKENKRVRKLKEKEYNHRYYDHLQVGKSLA